MTRALYNEIEPYAIEWIRNLAAAGHIPDGVVDERSIRDLAPADLVGPGPRHFFAGLGGWPLALRLAGIADDADVWTGSCPCQPISIAGKRLGAADDRHLWPDWFALIRECRPAVVFGEQVAGRAGRDWLSAVRADLERARAPRSRTPRCRPSSASTLARRRVDPLHRRRRAAGSTRSIPAG